jgi:predicted aldo/keto reductase-like oxidoreductase
VLLGCQSRGQVEEAVSYLTVNPAELDYTEAISGMSKEFRGTCVYCNHCLPCPVGIDIAAVTKYLDIALMDNTAADKGVGQHYRALSAHGSDCTQCGSCEKKCPLSVPIIQNMEKAKKIFSV